MCYIKQRLISVSMSVALVLLLTFTASACSNNDSADTNAEVSPYAAEFEEARKNATNDMQLEVLADDKITEAEIQELTGIYKACLEERDVDYDEGRLFQIGIATGGSVDANECQKNSVGQLQYLYQMVAINPTKADDTAVKWQCLVRRGIIPEDFTLDEFRYYADLQSYTYTFEETDIGTFIVTGENGEQAITRRGADGSLEVPDELGEPDVVILPNGVSMADQRVGRCEIDPRPESD